MCSLEILKTQRDKKYDSVLKILNVFQNFSKSSLNKVWNVPETQNQQLCSTMPENVQETPTEFSLKNSPMTFPANNSTFLAYQSFYKFLSYLQNRHSQGPLQRSNDTRSTCDLSNTGKADSCSSFPMTSLWTFEIFHAFSQNQSLSASFGSTAVSQNNQEGAVVAHETCLSFQWFPCTQQLSERDLFLHNTSFVLTLEIINKYSHSNFKTKLLKLMSTKLRHLRDSTSEILNVIMTINPYCVRTSLWTYKSFSKLP